MLAVFFQVASPNKYIGWGLMLVWFVAGIFLSNLGYNNILYTYDQTPLAPLSDMNGSGGFWVGAAWAQFYWLCFGLLLLLAAHLVWPRGAVTSPLPRFREMGKRFSLPAAAFGTVALAVSFKENDPCCGALN